MRIRELILTLAGVWLFTLGGIGEFTLAQSSRGESSDSRLKAIEKDQQVLTIELERRTIPIVEQMKSLGDKVQAMQDSQTWTNRAIIGAVGGYLLQQLLTMAFNYKRQQSSDKSQ